MRKTIAQSGIIHTFPLLIIVAAVGVISFLLISATLPLNGIFGTINTKPASQAATNGCQFLTAPGAVPIFCDTFDAPMGTGNRSGDLNGLIWGISRATSDDNPSQGATYNWSSVAMNKCGTTVTVSPPHDVAICNGMFIEGVNDGEGQTVLAAYPKQPFDFAGRTGTVVFDVTADANSPHGAWPEFVITDQPVPTPHHEAAGIFNFARNSYGFSIAANNPCGSGTTSVDSMFITRNYQNSALSFQQLGCVRKPTQLTPLNHFEVRISQNEVQVWATDPGSTTIKEIAVATNANLPLTRGLIWVADVHYNADKFDGQRVHTFAWDNIGFDGPYTYNDLAFDVPDKSPNNLGYLIPTGGSLTLQVPGIFNSSRATGVHLALNFWPHSADTLTYSVNGNPNHTMAWPFGASAPTFGSQTIAMPVPPSEIHDGTNTIKLQSTDNQLGGLSVANIDLILVAAGDVPCNINPSIPCNGSPIPVPTPSPSGAGKVGDLDNDGDVDIFDYAILVNNFGKTGLGDLDHDSDIDIFDYSGLIGNYGH